MARDLVAGIDSSTQSCTVQLRRLDDGSVVAEARAPHPPTTPPLSEQVPEAWREALEACLSQLKHHLPRIAALSVGGQGHGLVMLDEAGRSLRPAKLWNDTQSAADAERLLTAWPAAEWARRTGSVPAPALTVSKLAWTERNHPGLVAKARHIMLPFDYLVFRLAGHAVTERGGSSGTGYFNPFDNIWDFELADLAVPGIDWRAKLPDIVASNARAGIVCEDAGLGALAGAVVGAGTGDNMTAALGLNVREGDTVISLGTSGTIYGRCRTGVQDASGAINGYADAANGFLPMVTTLNAAKVTDAVRRLLDLSFEAFDELALSAPPGAEGLVLLPYFDGERTPNLPDATGTLLGLRSNLTRAGMARAAVEGVLCGLLEGGDILSRHGVPQDGRLILTGGAARSKAYRQVLADLTGRPVWIGSLTEAAAAGAAVQAAAALSAAPTDQVAAAWAPRLEIAAEPAGTDGAAVRQAYRQAAAAFGATRSQGST
ncbi:xylulokinase [Labrys wisconsinensis]|uniref:Xylulose kinase n=1 Tax=Labrys wisconsinensis TaxID=425677 RepID=A0ABU0JF35_9HYPH|nr:xylulokinase [Labrys wisconsinensis]MDQ0471884.1 xylulokinase [Labrys wisconsinensis]